MNNGTRREHSISNILVVIDSTDLSNPESGLSPLLTRAVHLARATGAGLELFYPCYDSTLELNLFASREDVAREKKRIAESAATQLAELALRLQSENLEIQHEVRWDQPDGETILRKIADSNPDLVMKQTREPNYIVGLSQYTDWELIRKSPAHIWFVKGDKQPADTVLTAIGGTTLDEGIITETDYQVFQIGNEVSKWLDAENHAVHCYEVPRVHAYATYTPFIAGAAHVEMEMKPWLDLAELHGEAINRFAEHFNIDAEDVILSREQPAQALPKQAQVMEAGLLVLGARNLSRWERLFSTVAAEPVLADAPCDLLIVKEQEDADIPQSDRQPRSVEPGIDVEMAIVHPEKVFGTPSAVVEADDLSGGLRKRILDIWEVDIQAQLRAEEEGGSVRSTKAGVLKEIHTARDELSAERARLAS